MSRQESLPLSTGRNPDCQLCDLWKSAKTPCLWGKGKSGGLMVISDSPGAQDDSANGVNQGQIGALLKDLMKQVGIDHSDCYFTHTAKCRPPENRPPSASEIKTCQPYLLEEVEAINPKFILTLGAVAIKAMTRKAKITEIHGQIIDYKGIPLIPTFHPAMALRDPSKMGPLRRDLQKLSLLMKGENPTVEDIPWKIISNIRHWNEFIDEFLESPELSVDIETNGLDRFAPGAQINSIQFGLSNGNNWSLPLNIRGSKWDKKTQSEFLHVLVDLSKGRVIIGQNLKFDNLWLWTHYGVKFRLRFDTMLASHTLDENRSHGLKELSADFCNAPNYDVDLKTKLGEGDLEKFYRYGCYDVHFTRQLYYHFHAQFRRDPVLRRLFYKLVMPSARMFEDIEEDGLFINLDQLEESEKSLTLQRDSLLRQLNKEAGKEINWSSPAQIGKLFYEDMGMPILEKTKGGAPSTSEAVLMALAMEHPVAKMLMDYRGVSKNLSTYVIGWKKLMHGDRLYLSTKLHGTVTGRYASRLHQVPRDPMIRSHIDAPEGWTMVVADYSQIELRLAAMLANEPRMKQIFQTGGDIHALTASILTGKPIDQVTKEERKAAKAVNFGFLYGMGAPKLVIYAWENYGVRMTLRESQAFRRRYFEVYAALPKWHERQKRCVRAFGQVVSLSGRVRRLPGVNSTDKMISSEAERQGINSPVQGFGSGDLKAMAMVEVHETFTKDQVRIKGEVHDSILMWVRSDQVDQHLPIIKGIMESPRLLRDFEIRMTVPLIADFEVGPWGRGKTYQF